MKSGKSFAWSVSGDNRLMALSAAFNDDPLAVTLCFMPEYAERFDWIVTQLKDWMFLVTTCEFFYYKKKAIENGGEWSIDGKAVFTSPAYFGEHLKIDAVRSWLNYFNETHGLPHFHPHQLRHTAISLELKAGIALTDVAKRAGHSRSDTTLRYYAHSMTENDRHCCEAITKILPDLPESKRA